MQMCPNTMLDPPGTLTKDVLLSYAFTLDPYNPMVL